MKRLHLPTRTQWRRWLAENHDQVRDGVWLVFYKKETGRPSLAYEDSVEEALCFGWVDSIIKNIDAITYCRKFTPRKDDSNWSNTNKRRAEKMMREGKMTEAGMAKVIAAKKSGKWNRDPRPVINLDLPQEFLAALDGNQKAKAFFEKMAPSYRKHFIAWIVTARTPVTKAKRVKASLSLLSRGQKLGLK